MEPRSETEPKLDKNRSEGSSHQDGIIKIRGQEESR